jgi:hypothetical protein
MKKKFDSLGRHKTCPCCSKDRFILKAFFLFTELLGDEKVKKFWCWELTPIPCGFPSWKQYVEGFWLFLRTTI